jgi:peptide/nickel transport system permease protein
VIGYLAKRLAHGAALLLVLSLLAFSVAQFAPGDPFSEMRNDPHISRGAVDAARARAGLDRPFPARYAAWLASLARGDLGYSTLYAAPVGSLLGTRVRATLILTVTATLIAWLIAVPFGIWNAAVRGSWLDGAARLGLAVLLAIPDLVLAVVLLAIGARTGWFPVGGMASTGAAGAADVSRHMLLPVAVLVMGMVPVLIRHVRSSVREAMDAPFTLNARAQGIGGNRLLFRHVLPAAAHPLISLFGLSLGTLLSGSLLVEVIVGWPGMGPLFLEAIMARDTSVVLATVLLSGALLIAGNLAADLLLYRLDPRIRVR